MSGETTIRVNFGRPVPLFPLNTVTLMPHSVKQLHIFEPRYREMISDALDGPGQIAMAVFEGDAWTEAYHEHPPVRPAVCIGQIVQHHKLPDGRYFVALQGVCRARIVEELPAEHQYREAMLEPIDTQEEASAEDALNAFRERIVSTFVAGPMAELRDAPEVVKHAGDEDLPVGVIVELLGILYLSDAETRYRFLAEGDVLTRARIVEEELTHLGSLIRRAAGQRPDEELPPGVSLN